MFETSHVGSRSWHGGSAFTYLAHVDIAGRNSDDPCGQLDIERVALNQSGHSLAMGCLEEPHIASAGLEVLQRHIRLMQRCTL